MNLVVMESEQPRETLRGMEVSNGCTERDIRKSAEYKGFVE
jgi:hypothetical protein